jgi:WD40 repeat protein
MTSPGENVAVGGTPVVEVFPVAIGYFTDPGLPDLEVDAQVGRLVDLLAPFGGYQHRWAAPARERGAGAVQNRLLEWATPACNSGGGSVAGSVLYWVGHGWSDGIRAALAHAESPARVGAAGVTPEQLADVIRTRQAQADDDTPAEGTRQDEGEGSGGWALVVVDTCRSRRFVELLVAALKAHDPPRRVLLLGVSGQGATTLGRFTDALRTVLHTTYMANGRIGLTELAAQFPRLLPGCEVSALGDLSGAELVPVFPPVASWMSAPLDTVRHLEDVLEDLSPDERRHFLIKAQGAEYGEMSWFFEGRQQERAQIVAWLKAHRSGMLIVSGRAGSGKSALLGNVLVHSLPELRDALARRGLITTLDPTEGPPEGVFDAVIHLSGLTLPQITGRIAAAAGLGPLPSRTDPTVGIATDLDWLAEHLTDPDTTPAGRLGRPFTVLADALDEAIDPLDTARSLLGRIAALPGVRVLVGTRASTHETPDAPAEDTNLLDALTITGPPVRPGRDPGRHRETGSGQVWVARDADAIRRYVARRLRQARDHGRRGVAVPGLRRVSDADIDRVATVVAGPEREFLYARLAVYELIEEPRLLTGERATSLSTLLEGDHQDLFAKALDRLARLDDRYPTLLRALALARGRGLPEADGIWATIATALTPTHTPSRGSAAADPTNRADTLTPTENPADGGSDWAQAIHDLLTAAAAYVIVDTPSSDTHDTLHRQRYRGDPSRAPAPSGLADQDATGVGWATVYRLAHRTFVEYFTTRAHHAGTLGHDRRQAATGLLHAARRLAALDPAAMPPYLVRHLSGHAADAECWDALADHPRVLDGLDPHAVTADALRTLFGRRLVPPPVAGVIGARDALAGAAPADRAGLRQLATTTHSTRQVVDEPATGWGVAAAQAGRVTMHVRLTGHTAAVSRIRYLTLPGRGTVLASASDDGTIRLWDPDTATPIGTPLTGHTSTVEDLTVLTHPDGRTLLASAGRDETVRIWDPTTGHSLGDPLTGHTSPVVGVCPLPGRDPDGRTLLASAGQDGTVRIWDPTTGHSLGDPLTGHTGGVWGVCPLPGWDPDGRTLLATTGQDGTVRIWDPTTGHPLGDPLTGHTGPVWGVCPLPGWDPDGHPDGRTLLATTGQDGTVRIWDPTTGHPLGDPLAESPASIHALAARGTDGTDCLTLASDGALRRWSASSASLATIPSTGHTCSVIVHTDTGHDVLLTGDTAGLLHTTDLTTQLPLHPPVRIDDGAVLALCPLPGQPATLATAGRNGTITLHPLNPATGTTTTAPRLHGHTGPVRDLCLIEQPDHPPLLASAGNDGIIRLWDLSPAAPHGAPLTGHDGWIWSIITVPGPPGQGPRLASAGADATIRLWDPLTGHQLGQPLTGHTDQVRALTSATTADGGSTLLVSGSHDGTIRLWDPTTGAPLHTIPLTTPIHALLQQQPDQRSRERTNNGATLTVGLRTGILTLDIHHSLFPTHPATRNDVAHEQ